MTRFFNRHPTRHTWSQRSCASRLCFTYLQQVTDIRNTRLGSDSCQPSTIHPNSFLGIFTHHSQISSQPSKWLLCTCTWHWATTTQGSGLLHLLPSPTRKVGWDGGPGEASYCWWATLPYSGDFHTQRITCHHFVSPRSTGWEHCDWAKLSSIRSLKILEGEFKDNSDTFLSGTRYFRQKRP